MLAGRSGIVAWLLRRMGGSSRLLGGECAVADMGGMFRAYGRPRIGRRRRG